MEEGRKTKDTHSFEQNSINDDFILKTQIQIFLLMIKDINTIPQPRMAIVITPFARLL